MTTESIIQKCKCGSVWCPRCFVQKHAGGHVSELNGFDWRRTREIVLTIDPSEFSSGREAHEHISSHKGIPGLIRNLKRGLKERNKSGVWVWKYKPIKITKWKWFLEWHESGYPHWHLFIEVARAGPSGRIGGNMIRHYWPWAVWVFEHYFKTQQHWRNQTGYFQKNGYFHKNKKHQTRLPPWAINIKGLKIRRSGSGKKKKSDQDLVTYLENKMKQCDVIDIKTGEIVKPAHQPREYVKRDYKTILESCGKYTRITINSGNSLCIAIIDRPYKEVIAKIPGHYGAKKGICFSLQEDHIEWLFSRVLRVERLDTSHGMQAIKHKIESLHDSRVGLGYWKYQKYYG